MDDTRPTPPASHEEMVQLLPELIKQDVSLIVIGTHTDEEYSACILGVRGTRIQITLPRAVISGGYLRKSGPVIAVFALGDYLYEADANYIADSNRVRELTISGEIRRSNRRRYARIIAELPVSYAPVSEISIKTGHLTHLVWKKAITGDISGGGILMYSDSVVVTNSYVILHLDVDELRWTGMRRGVRPAYESGIMFVPSEQFPDHFSQQTIARIPPALFQFDKKKRLELNEFFMKYAKLSSEGENHGS
jgi:hypothetical protein